MFPSSPWSLWNTRLNPSSRAARRRSSRRVRSPLLERLEDRTAPAVDLVSWGSTLLEPGNGASSLSGGAGPSVSASGRYVAFQSRATDLVAGQTDTNGTWDVFVQDRVTQVTTLVSRAGASGTVAGNGASTNPSISADGRYIAYQSQATDLIEGQSDSNNSADVFVYDRVTGQTVLVSSQSGTTQTAANGRAIEAQISADGSQIVFVSTASNLVAGQSDANGVEDVFVYDRVSQTVTLVSHAAGQPATAGDQASTGARVSENGRFIAYQTMATNLVAGVVDENAVSDVYLYDRVEGTTTLVSHASDSLTMTGDLASDSPVISADGSVVVFTGYATTLDANVSDENFNIDVFVYDRASQAVTLVSRTAEGTTSGDNFSYTPAVSGDGRYVAYASAASDLVAGQSDSNGDLDVFLYDRVAGTQVLVSHLPGTVATAGAGFALRPSISGDGRVVVFAATVANLVAGVSDTNSTLDVFSYDRVTTEVKLLSGSAADPNVAGDGLSELPQVTTSGRVVVFQSGASNLVTGDNNSATDVFVYLLPNSRPVAQANGPYAVVEGGSVVLSAAGSSDVEQSADSLQYEWDLDGDGIYGEVGAGAVFGDEIGASPTVTLRDVNGPTTITVSLRVTDDGGLSATDTATLEVSNAAPTATIGGPYSVPELGTVQLSGAGSDPGGDTLTYAWDLDGDGIFGETGIGSVRGNETIANPIFSAAGLDGPRSWVVSLRVIDQDGLASETVTTTIQVTNAAPTAHVNGPYTVGEGRSVQLNGTGSDPATFLDPLTYAWDLDGDGIFGETGVDALHGDEVGQKPYFTAVNLDGPSTYTIWLKVTDDEGASHVDSGTVNITNVAPMADADGPYAVVEGSSIVLSGAGADPGGDTLTYTWDLDGDGVFGESGVDALRGDEVGQHPTFSAVGLDGPDTITVTLKVTDQDGLSALDSALIEVGNAAPSASLGGPYSTVEGGQIGLSGSATDAGGDELTYAWDLDNDGVFGETGPDALHGDEVGPTPTFYVRGLDGPAMVPIALRVTDDDGLAGAIQYGTVSILPTAPTLGVTGPTSGVRGQPRYFDLAATDASTLDQAAGFTYQINWGDGTPVQTIAATEGNGAGLSVRHIFAKGGRFEIRVVAIDRDGQISGTQTHVVGIVAIQMQPDPRTPSRTALVVGGTTGNERIEFAPGAKAGTVRVLINNRQYGVYRPTGRVIAYGQAGADVLIVQRGVRLKAELYGGSGNDRLVGGDQHDILSGGAGNDVLQGNGGRDLLLGGAGVDRLEGHWGEDILIGGTTVYDNDEVALREILQRWMGSSSFNGRVNLLRDRLQVVYLITGETVIPDRLNDAYLGGPERNWNVSS